MNNARLYRESSFIPASVLLNSSVCKYEFFHVIIGCSGNFRGINIFISFFFTYLVKRFFDVVTLRVFCKLKYSSTGCAGWSKMIRHTGKVQIMSVVCFPFRYTGDPNKKLNTEFRSWFLNNCHGNLEIWVIIVTLSNTTFVI